eukprot:540153-Hanusia_phi.AAC.1
MTARQHDPVAMIRCRATTIHPLDRLRKLRKLGGTFPMWGWPVPAAESHSVIFLMTDSEARTSSSPIPQGPAYPVALTCTHRPPRSAGPGYASEPPGPSEARPPGGAPAPGAAVSERPAGVRE